MCSYYIYKTLYLCMYGFFPKMTCPLTLILYLLWQVCFCGPHYSVCQFKLCWLPELPADRVIGHRFLCQTAKWPRVPAEQSFLADFIFPHNLFLCVALCLWQQIPTSPLHFYQMVIATELILHCTPTYITFSREEARFPVYTNWCSSKSRSPDSVDSSLRPKQSCATAFLRGPAFVLRASTHKLPHPRNWNQVS